MEKMDAVAEVLKPMITVMKDQQKQQVEEQQERQEQQREQFELQIKLLKSVIRGHDKAKWIDAQVNPR